MTQQRVPIQEQQPQRRQQEQLQQLEQQRAQQQQQLVAPQLKEGPAVVTRVVDELMVFVSVDDEEGAIGLVFKPDKIDEYDGSSLATLGVRVGARLPAIVWDSRTRLVQSVQVDHRSDSTPRAMSSL